MSHDRIDRFRCDRCRTIEDKVLNKQRIDDDYPDVIEPVGWRKTFLLNAGESLVCPKCLAVLRATWNEVSK